MDPTQQTKRASFFIAAAILKMIRGVGTQKILNHIRTITFMTHCYITNNINQDYQDERDRLCYKMSNYKTSKYKTSKIQNVELQNADYKTSKVTKGRITKRRITKRRKLQKEEKQKVESYKMQKKVDNSPGNFLQVNSEEKNQKCRKLQKV